jgi:hypothetical protein
LISRLRPRSVRAQQEVLAPPDEIPVFLLRFFAGVRFFFLRLRMV